MRVCIGERNVLSVPVWGTALESNLDPIDVKDGKDYVDRITGKFMESAEKRCENLRAIYAASHSSLDPEQY